MHKITDGVTLKYWRMAHGVSQASMAKHLGIHTHTLSDIENGRVVADVDYLAKAETLLNAIPPKHSTHKVAQL